MKIVTAQTTFFCLAKRDESESTSPVFVREADYTGATKGSIWGCVWARCVLVVRGSDRSWRFPVSLRESASGGVHELSAPRSERVSASLLENVKEINAIADIYLKRWVNSDYGTLAT